MSLCFTVFCFVPASIFRDSHTPEHPGKSGKSRATHPLPCPPSRLPKKNFLNMRIYANICEQTRIPAPDTRTQMRTPADNTRTIREQYANNTRTIREQYANNMRTICERARHLQPA